MIQHQLVIWLTTWLFREPDAGKQGDAIADDNARQHQHLHETLASGSWDIDALWWIERNNRNR